MTLQELQEKRAKLATEIRTKGEAFHANNKQWKDASERTNWEKLNSDYNALMTEMREASAADEVEKRLKSLDEDEERSTNPDRKPGMDDYRFENRDDGDDEETRGEHRTRQERRHERRKLPDEETRSLAMAGWIRDQMDEDVPDVQQRAMKACGYKIGQRKLKMENPDSRWIKRAQREWRAGNQATALERTLESRALSDITFSTGGMLVPRTFIQQLEINMLAYGGMLQTSTILTTSDGGTLTLPTADDTTNTGSRLGENTAPTGTAQPTFGGVQWNAYKYTSNPILVPHELLEDAFIDLPGYLGDALAERLGRTLNTDFTVGTGANQPKGIITCSTSGRSSGSANAISFDDVIYLEHSIDPAYRTNAEFMCHDNVVLAVRLLKDSNNRYIWTYGVDSGQPDKLDGKRLTVNQDMASTIATGSKALLYGQLNRYIIRRVGPNRFYRLTERYRDTDQDGFLMFMRADGNLKLAGTQPTKYLTIS